MVVRYDALLCLAGEVRGGTLIVGVLGAHAPATRLPEGTKVFGMIRSRLIALEAIQEDRLFGAVTEPLP